jgi:hypothetical protein
MPNVIVMMYAMRGQPKLGLRRLISTIALIRSQLGPLGPCLPLLRGKKIVDTSV